MTKQQLVTLVAQRLGDEDPNFITLQLSPIFDMVLLELAQADCLTLRRQTSILLNQSGCSSAYGILNIATPTVLSLTTGQTPERIYQLFVPAWGKDAGWITRISDEQWNAKWLGATATDYGKPKWWRVFPNLSQLQLYPNPNTTDAAATCLIEWEQNPTTLNNSDTIVDVLYSDLPTLLAGVYRHGIIFRDETLSDLQVAEARWQQGCQTMRERKLRANFYGRRNQVAYRDF